MTAQSHGATLTVQGPTENGNGLERMQDTLCGICMCLPVYDVAEIREDVCLNGRCLKLTSSCKLAHQVHRELHQRMLKLEYWMQAHDLGGLTASAERAE